MKISNVNVASRVGRVVNRIPPPTPHFPPVHFFAEADVNAGAEVTLRSEALTNRTGKPVEIHEIRLAARFGTEATVSEVDPGSFVRARISIAGKPITNGFIPLWLLGKTEARSSQVASGTEAASIYVWRLSRPLVLTGKTPIEAEFQHTGAVKFATRAQIGLAGKYAASTPSTFNVPYASAFVSRSFSFSEVGFDESSEKDLVNVTGRSVNVDRIIGRIGIARTENTAIAFVNDVPGLGSVSLVTLRILTSGNLPIIRDYSSPFAVFGFPRAIDCPHVMRPNDFYRVGVKKIAGPTITTPFITWGAQANVSIVGWREEAL